MKHLALGAALAFTIVACGSDSGSDPATPEATGSDPTGTTAPPASRPREVVVQLGDDVAPAVRERFVAHVKELEPQARVAAANEALDALGKGSLVLAVGTTWTTDRLVAKNDVDALAAEGYVLRSGALGDATAMVAKGKPRARLEHANAGNAYGAFAMLEELGFSFLHPLAPTKPEAFTLANVSRREEPRWSVRGIQLHTMHPLELTDLLNGWGPSGPNDGAGWEAMLPEWDRFLEWMLANGQNRVHWVLLEADSWSDFATSETRRQRLVKLVDRAHAFDIDVGADVPIVLQQQHTFRLITKTGDLNDELSQLHTRVDWLMSAGFDYLATENGTTEFTHPDPARMLAWMNELATYAKAPTYVKIHCSTGQTADGYPDPVTGQPINFNMLPHFADKKLGVMPHTVQHYGLDDPAPTYGNTDFGYMRDYLKLETKLGEREVLWHPETAYWVSFDIDVPLFLPVYAERRVHDLRLIAGDEKSIGKRMTGQQTFSSGWEWGYWLNDVVTARAAWNPHEEAQTDEAALEKVLDDALRSPFGAAAPTVRDLVVETARVEHDVLILGKVGGVAPSKIDKRNGQAYLQGWETWDDVNELAMAAGAALKRTQPAKLGLVDMRSPLSLLGPKYTGEIDLLLTEMENDLGALDAKWDAARTKIPAGALDLFDDLRAAMRMTALRAKQLHGLYDYVDMRNDADASPRLARLATARGALDDAAKIVADREKHYRVPADRIAGWGYGPTAYEHRYLWTARTLFYWWRDEGKAVDAPRSPCYLNITSPVDIAMGEGTAFTGANALSVLLGNPNGTDLTDCAAAPASMPTFPQYGLRSRP